MMIYLDCKVCGKPMPGVLCESVRDTCDGCGGRSLKNPPKPENEYGKKLRSLPDIDPNPTDAA
jgi:hypothetical protein